MLFASFAIVHIKLVELPYFIGMVKNLTSVHLAAQASSLRGCGLEIIQQGC